MEKTLTIEEKIERILNTNYLEEVSLDCLPPVQTDKYYFVSYSHKDYKLVYKDILNLQQRGFSIWYDRGMEAGKNWRETAEKYITKYNCAGVIFYLSENSLLSGAVHEEIKLIKEYGKAFLTINLPLDNEYMSASKMMDELLKKGHKIDESKKDFIKENLNDDIIYIRYDSSYENKSEKIDSLKPGPLFVVDKFEVNDKRDTIEDQFFDYIWPYRATLEDTLLETKSINDLEVKEISLKDYQNSISEDLIDAKLVRIGDSTFSNCRRLKCVKFPKDVSVLGNFAFYNCIKLEDIDLSGITMIKSHAFENCTSIKSLDLSRIKSGSSISDFMCKNCMNLTNVKLPYGLNKIGKCAFENTNIETVTTSYLFGEGILSHAFYGCKNLKIFKVLGDSDFKIGYCAFAGSLNMKEFICENAKIEVQKEAFINLHNLESFPFESVSKIDTAAFKNCKSLKDIKVKACDIGVQAFMGCESIEMIEFIGDESYNIEFSAFENCSNLKVVKLSKNLKSVSPQAFRNCYKLQEIYFDGTFEEFKTVFSKCLNPGFDKTNPYKIICIDKVLTKDNN